MTSKIDQSVIGIVFSKDQVLLIKRRDVPVWVLPGGGLDEKETPEQGVVREVLEETGFEVEIIRKVGEYSPINRLARFTHLFECKIIKGSPMIGSETKDVQFFSIKNLPKLLPPPYDVWINDSYKKGPFIQKKLTTLTYFILFKNLMRHPILVIRFILSRIGLTINT